MRDAVDVVVRDGRYRRYLLGCFLEDFFGMLYLPLIRAFLSTTLGFDYRWCAALMHGIPAFTAFVTTGCWAGGLTGPIRGFRGPAFVSPSAWMRCCWRPRRWAAALLHPFVFLLPILGRLLRGSVQGGWWILWWQVGVTHFAPPGKTPAATWAAWWWSTAFSHRGLAAGMGSARPSSSRLRCCGSAGWA